MRLLCISNPVVLGWFGYKKVHYIHLTLLKSSYQDCLPILSQELLYSYNLQENQLIVLISILLDFRKVDSFLRFSLL